MSFLEKDRWIIESKNGRELPELLMHYNLMKAFLYRFATESMDSSLTEESLEELSKLAMLIICSEEDVPFIEIEEPEV